MSSADDEEYDRTHFSSDGTVYEQGPSLGSTSDEEGSVRTSSIVPARRAIVYAHRNVRASRQAPNLSHCQPVCHTSLSSSDRRWKPLIDPEYEPAALPQETDVQRSHPSYFDGLDSDEQLQGYEPLEPAKIHMGTDQETLLVLGFELVAADCVDTPLEPPPSALPADLLKVLSSLEPIVTTMASDLAVSEQQSSQLRISTDTNETDVIPGVGCTESPTSTNSTSRMDSSGPSITGAIQLCPMANLEKTSDAIHGTIGDISSPGSSPSTDRTTSALPQLTHEQIKCIMDMLVSSISNRAGAPPSISSGASSHTRTRPLGDGDNGSVKSFVPSSEASSATLVDRDVPVHKLEPPFAHSSRPWTPCVDIIHANGGKPAEWWKEGRTAVELQNWMTKACPTSWKLRLIIGTREAATASVATLPFDAQTYSTMNRQFGLPADMLDAAKQNHEFMTQVFEQYSVHGCPRYTFMFRMMNFHQDGCCLGLSYDPESRSTYALLLGLMDQPGQAVNAELADELHASAAVAWHPLFLPLLVLRQRSEKVDEKMKDLLGSKINTEPSLGFDGPPWQTSSLLKQGCSQTALTSANIDAAYHRLCRLTSDMRFIQWILELLLGTLEKLQFLLNTVFSETAISSGLFPDADKGACLHRHRIANDMVQRRICYLSAVSASRLLRVKALRENSERQLHLVRNLNSPREPALNPTTRK